MRKLLDALSKEGASRGIRARLMAIIDSDTKFPGHTDAVTQKIVRECDELGITLHVLEKRAIENYASDRVLESRRRRGQETWCHYR